MRLCDCRPVATFCDLHRWSAETPREWVERQVTVHEALNPPLARIEWPVSITVNKTYNTFKVDAETLAWLVAEGFVE